MTILALLLAVLLPGPQSDTFTIKSEILGQTRRVFVHVPQSFAKSGAARRYPTIVVFDGKYVMDSVVTMSDILTRDGQMPESVVVAIDNIDDDDGRVHDPGRQSPICCARKVTRSSRRRSLDSENDPIS
jgi:enterochelin esterase-like enzyme